MWTFSKRGFLTLIALIWITILGVISPAWFSIGVVLVTGTSKGIGVSLGSEGNLYFCAGVVILVLGLVIFTISFRVIIRYFRKLKKGLSFVPIILFGVCIFCTIAFTVGIVEYLTQSFNRFLIISLDVLICRYSPLLRAFPALFISEEPHKSFYYPSCFHSQK